MPQQLSPRDLEIRLKAQVDFPSPSPVAAEIIALARDPDIEMSKVAHAVGRDPAMTAKILRIANSAFYAQKRPSQNLRQALVVIGLNAALTLALSFSLLSSLRSLRPQGIDYPRFWRRALLAATAARAFSAVARTGHEEDWFLAGLLQDMGILALDRAVRDFYAGLPPGAGHAEWIAYEIAALGRDHAAFSAVLLKSWHLPEKLWLAAEHSHRPEKLDARSEAGVGARCVALGSELAEAVVADDRPAALERVAGQAQRLLGLRDEQFTQAVTLVLQLIPEAEVLYETSIIDPDDADALLAEARELLAVRNLHALQEVSALQATASVLLSRTEELEDASRRDPLTGALNRAWLDRLLDREFTQAVIFGRTLSVAHVDLDHFKNINEEYGMQAGDQVLRSCAQVLQASVRGSDQVARFSGKEFLVLLPGADAAVARQVAQRMLEAIRDTAHVTDAGTVRLTASIGLATFTPQQRFPNAQALLGAADHALYAATLRGRNRYECFEDL
ncbi:MAG: GGDEF domain-containing protein [Proteobacteria bacterium]|nr:MAG: GGDEF domain-containing protein [Pseudomonadota bacterium]